MKVFPKIIVLILVFVLSLPCVTFAKENEYAKLLYEMGIIYGTDNGFEEERTLTRAEAIAVVVRLLGEEESIDCRDFEQKFTDVPENHWAFGYVMYCYQNNITYGTGEDTFSPDSEIDARQFVALVLRTMGYSAPYEDTMEKAVECQLFNSDVQKDFETNKFTRGDMFYTLYRSLKTQRNDKTLMADYLAEKGVISKKQAEKFDLYENFEHIDELMDNLLN